MVDPSGIFEELHGELAISLIACRARLDKHAVHSLRTTARRLEALLGAVQRDHPRSANLQRSVKETLRPLKSLRGAAGPVRDMDVQRGLLATIAESLGHSESEAERRRLKADGEELDDRLQRRRKRLAAELASAVKDSERTLEDALDDVGSRVKELGKTPLFETAGELAVQSSAQLKEITRGSLHRYRKQTKAARYLGEMAKTSVPAKRLAKRLKTVLDHIGQWHDLMLLAREAKATIGKRSMITKALKVERGRAWGLAIRSVGNMRKRL
jgi:CHAD domain-containing protein